jgi:hypothetical protein
MTAGSCLCGGVKFEVESFASDIYKCHCSKCRKIFGGASSAAALASKENFSWLQGKELRHSYKPPESDYGTQFCSNCGSLVPIYIEAKKLYWIPVGLLESDPGIPLTRHIHTASRASWEILDEHTEKLEEGFEW